MNIPMRWRVAEQLECAESQKTANTLCGLTFNYSKVARQEKQRSDPDREVIHRRTENFSHMMVNASRALQADACKDEKENRLQKMWLIDVANMRNQTSHHGLLRTTMAKTRKRKKPVTVNDSSDYSPNMREEKARRAREAVSAHYHRARKKEAKRKWDPPKVLSPTVSLGISEITGVSCDGGLPRREEEEIASQVLASLYMVNEARHARLQAQAWSPLPPSSPPPPSTPDTPPAPAWRLPSTSPLPLSSPAPTPPRQVTPRPEPICAAALPPARTRPRYVSPEWVPDSRPGLWAGGRMSSVGLFKYGSKVPLRCVPKSFGGTAP
ncbi:hypothetical protein DFH06DRAFT_1131424 [Mycena polygramma]|nr:hypothetical protein DFH06DRAFT_1147899 [Mycena polygramma]KAJ7657642.1 hypothetical protein DFH06DRAFT_1131424 [Mycena polygramma]